MAGDRAGSSSPIADAWSPATPESPPEQVSTASPPSPRGRARGSASALASSSRSWKSSAQAAPASSTRARNTRWSPASEPVWAAAARAPAADEPTLSTATPTPRSAHSASASASFAPSSSDSRKRATERTPSRPASAASQSLASATVWLPVETTVCQRIPRREPSAFTPTLPLWVTIATEPGSSAPTRSPQIAAREGTATIPLPLGPHTGRSCARAISRSSASWARPAAISPKPADSTTAPLQPRSTPARRASATEGAGIAITSASTGSGNSEISGTHARPSTSRRFGFTPHTWPSNPARSRFRSTLPP